MENLTITKIVSGLKAKKFSCREVVSHYLKNIKGKNEEIRAYLDVFEEEALRQADGIDEKIGAEEIDTTVMGMPIAVKDNILIRGTKTTAGSKILEPYIASYSATVIEKLKHAGAVFLGKTNLDEFAMGSSTENSAFGPTRNPYDLGRVPGGSSGGSAAAVAADLALAALGSDTGGSIRQPASFCGVVGLKPTYGGVSRHGLIAMASSLDQIGPITKTVEDASLLFEAIRGRDRYDATTVETKPFVLDRRGSLRGLKVGVPKEYFGEGLEGDVGARIHQAIAELTRLGAEVQEISLPHARLALPVYYLVMPAEVSANLARFDGIRYGFSIADRCGHSQSRTDAENLYEVYAKTRADGFSAEVKRRIMLGTYALSAGYYDAYYNKAQQVRRLIQEDFKSAFRTVDIIVGPTSPTPAFRLGERTANPLQMYLADIYTVAVNLAGIPALSLPCGTVEREEKNLPVGLQFIGKWFDETTILSAAYTFEQGRKS